MWSSCSFLTREESRMFVSLMDLFISISSTLSSLVISLVQLDKSVSSALHITLTSSALFILLMHTIAFMVHYCACSPVTFVCVRTEESNKEGSRSPEEGERRRHKVRAVCCSLISYFGNMNPCLSVYWQTPGLSFTQDMFFFILMGDVHFIITIPLLHVTKGRFCLFGLISDVAAHHPKTAVEAERREAYVSFSIFLKKWSHSWNCLLFLFGIPYVTFFYIKFELQQCVAVRQSDAQLQLLFISWVFQQTKMIFAPKCWCHFFFFFFSENASSYPNDEMCFQVAWIFNTGYFEMMAVREWSLAWDGSRTTATCLMLSVWEGFKGWEKPITCWNSDCIQRQDYLSLYQCSFVLPA